MSKPLSSRHASIGISVPDWANDWTTYSGNWIIVGRLSWLDWMYLSMAEL